MSGFLGHDLRVTTDFALTPHWHGALAPRPVWIGPVTQTVFDGTPDNDHFTGGGAADVFNMEDGGNDVVKGKGQDDSFFFGASLTAADKIDGGRDSGNPFIGDRDALYLDGDYSAGLVFGPATMIGVETIILTPGHSYDLTIDDATVAAADFLTVRNASPWGVDDNLTFDGSAETNGFLRLFGCPGVDTLTGGALGDEFTFSEVSLSASDRIDGGSGGFDVLYLSGDYGGGLVMDPDTIANIDVIYFSNGFDYSLTIANGSVAPGETLNVSGAFLEAGSNLSFDGFRERDSKLNVYGGDDIDVLGGGRKADYLQGNGGADTLTGRLGADTFGYAGFGESDSAAYDTVAGFDFDAMDKFDTWFDVTGTDATVVGGRLRSDHLDADLKHLIGTAQLGEDHAVLFMPNHGDLAGTTFLLIDALGQAGYQTGDLVVRLDTPANIASIDASDFI